MSVSSGSTQGIIHIDAMGELKHMHNRGISCGDNGLIRCSRCFGICDPIPLHSDHGSDGGSGSDSALNSALFDKEAAIDYDAEISAMVNKLSAGAKALFFTKYGKLPALHIGSAGDSDTAVAVPASPIEKTIPSPIEETIAAPIEETIAAPIEETIATPIEEVIASPIEEVSTSPIKEIITAFTEKPSVFSTEEITFSPVKQIIASLIEEIIIAPTEEAPISPVEEIMTSPTMEITTAPTEEIITAPTEETLASPAEETLAAPTTEQIITAPMEETPASPAEEILAAPVKEQITKKSSRDSDVFPTEFLSKSALAKPKDLFLERGTGSFARTVHRNDPRDEARTVLMWAAGSCLDNNGSGSKAGWAVVHAVGRKGNNPLVVSGQLTNDGQMDGSNSPTACRAELQGAIAALRYQQDSDLDGLKNVVIATNSEYVTMGATVLAKKWAAKGWMKGNAPVKNRDLWEELLDEVARLNDEGVATQFWRIQKDCNTMAGAAARIAAMKA
ncbi:hypothetical protein F5Y14DRAFT_201746 [Nemania sp. NC0429]|nr:hypothetical protein F5Y14DRAFT_201746 [Nemania sp. NC0429]